MFDFSPTRGALVLYKIRPAVVHAVDDKIGIELEGGKTKRVRPKDIAVLHPGPIASLAELGSPEGDVNEAWELLAGGTTELQELAELIYGEFSPAAAWAAWRLVMEGLYFEGTPGQINVRDVERVAADIATREAAVNEERRWQDFLLRMQKKTLLAQDRERLTEVERLAVGQLEHSRVLSALGKKENPESAHRLLLSLGYWPAEHNPFPQRQAVAVADPQLIVPELQAEERLDLMHLESFAIDDEGSADPDDAISLDGERIWVHVADVAALVAPGSAIDLEARARAANLYLPERVVNMLPPQITDQLGLGLQEKSPALSFGFLLDDGAQPYDLQIRPSWVRVCRQSYSEIDERLGDEPFATLVQKTRRYRQRRLLAGAINLELPEVSVRVAAGGEIRIRSLPRLGSREMVTEAMLMAGEAAARFALQEGIALPYATQRAVEGPPPAREMAAMYAFRRKLKPSRSTTLEEPHAGLGLELYSRVTSPLRRYLDLVAHQQLRLHLLTGASLPASEVSERIAVTEQPGAAVRRTERLSNMHWKLVYLQRNHGWQGDSVVVEMSDRRATLLIPELALETRLRLAHDVALNTVLPVALQEVDLPTQTARFRVL